MRIPLVIIEAPSNLGLMLPAPGREPGTRKAPDVLRDLGLHAALKPERIMRVDAPPYEPDDARTVNVRNIGPIAEHAVRLADAVESVVRAGSFPLVLGGDCSLLIGSMLGLRRLGNTALLFIDGHTDFYLPEQSSTGGAAGMDLALATGWGPAMLTDIDGLKPYVDIHHVAALGNRDHHKRRRADIPDIDKAGLYYRPLAALRREGMESAAKAAMAAIAAPGGHSWIHFDVDVIDSTLMPAVDSPQADGLDWSESEDLLRTALAGNAAGLQVTIYDPDRDPDLKAGKALVKLTASVLAGYGGEPSSVSSSK
jgi:arginase